MKDKSLFINSISHFFVDTICASTLFSFVGDMASLVTIYNTLAFSTQCLFGAFLDSSKKVKESLYLSFVLLLMGALVPINVYIKVILVGIGNSIFHVSGGYTTLNNSQGKIADLGIFVAPGCMGLTLGTLFPGNKIVYVVGILLCMFLSQHVSLDKKTQINEADCDNKFLLVCLLLISVAVRAVGGSVVSFPWKNTALLSIVMTTFVFLGKFFGGYITDLFSIKKVAIISTIIASVFITFGNNNMILSLIGQFSLNLSMPITLYLLYRLYPNDPGTAFGLSACALWPGTIIGLFITLTGIYAKALTLLSFVVSLLAIIYVKERI